MIYCLMNESLYKIHVNMANSVLNKSFSDVDPAGYHPQTPELREPYSK